MARFHQLLYILRQRMFVPSGTVNPACSAIQVAGLPTMSAFNFAPAQFLLFALTPKQNSSRRAFLFCLQSKCGKI